MIRADQRERGRVADDLPEIALGLDGAARPVVLLGEAEEADDMAGLLRLAPALAGPAHALALARAANHFAAAAEYRVIENPAAFEAAYRARLAGEDPAAPFVAGVIRLRDFGVPDFTAITPPAFADGVLRFFAEHRFIGLPYRAETADLASPPVYAPMPLTPLPSPEAPEDVADEG